MILPIPKRPDQPCRCYAAIDVTPFLVGRPLDDIAWGWLESLRPSSIRVAYGEIKCDAQTWRVTIHLSQAMLIESVSQEVELGSPDMDGTEMLGAVGL